MECSNCKKTFPQNPKRFSKEDKYKALMMYLNNVGIRKIALFFGVSAPAVLKWIRNAHKLLQDSDANSCYDVAFNKLNISEQHVMTKSETKVQIVQ